MKKASDQKKQNTISITEGHDRQLIQHIQAHVALAKELVEVLRELNAHVLQIEKMLKPSIKHQLLRFPN
jgi:hypothetical protein